MRDASTTTSTSSTSNKRFSRLAGAAAVLLLGIVANGQLPASGAASTGASTAAKVTCKGTGAKRRCTPTTTRKPAKKAQTAQSSAVPTTVPPTTVPPSTTTLAVLPTTEVATTVAVPSSTEPTTSTTRPFPTTQEGLQREMLEVFMARNPVLVEGEAQTREIDCESKALVIKTTLSWVSTKHCWPILVHGSKNNVIIDLLGGTAPGLWITGDDNVVRYASGSCCIAIAGQRTRVVRGG